MVRKIGPEIIRLNEFPKSTTRKTETQSGRCNLEPNLNRWNLFKAKIPSNCQTRDVFLKHLLHSSYLSPLNPMNVRFSSIFKPMAEEWFLKSAFRGRTPVWKMQNSYLSILLAESSVLGLKEVN